MSIPHTRFRCKQLSISRIAGVPLVSILIDMKITSGLVLELAGDGNDMRRARRTKGILHALGYARIVAEQNARKERTCGSGTRSVCAMTRVSVARALNTRPVNGASHANGAKP